MPDNEREQILCRTLQLVGFDRVDMDNFNNRLIYQKVIYLMQNFGLSLGYGYSWYVKGPYSPDLAKTLFNITPTVFAESGGFVYKDNEKIIEKIATFKNILEGEFHNYLFLEILASIVFIQKSISIDGDNRDEKLKLELLKLKPKLGENSEFESTFSKASKLISYFTS